MKKSIILTVFVSLGLTTFAQDTYQNAKVSDTDLNGTARYVSMGGAMEALGADISTISSNPAGIGMFRRSQASISGGLNISEGKLESMSGNKVTPTFDQAGFVFATHSSSNSYINFAVNYHLSKNYNGLYSVTDQLDYASQNKISAVKLNDNYTPNQIDRMWDDYLYSDDIPTDCSGYYYTVGKNTREKYYYRYFDGGGYIMERKNSGYTGTYDINISGNMNNQIYLGLTVGIKDVHMKSSTAYAEVLDCNRTATILDDRQVTGHGFDVKAGIIIRPIETSPFRIGAYIHTPTFYTLRTSNNTDLYVENNRVCEYQGHINNELKYRVNTPWLFGLSLGHTVGTSLAFGLTYEYQKWSAMDNRCITDSYYSNYGGYSERSASDDSMNKDTQLNLQGTHTIRVGAEARLFPKLSLRLGYNWVSPKYKNSAFRDLSIDSQGTSYSSTYDYTNWKDTHRFTCGLGYSISDHFNIDVAYMYQSTKGEFCPFMSYEDNDGKMYDCIAYTKDITDVRHKVLATLTYKF